MQVTTNDTFVCHWILSNGVIGHRESMVTQTLGCCVLQCCSPTHILNTAIVLWTTNCIAKNKLYFTHNCFALPQYLFSVFGCIHSSLPHYSVWSEKKRHQRMKQHMLYTNFFPQNFCWNLLRGGEYTVYVALWISPWGSEMTFGFSQNFCITERWLAKVGQKACGQSGK